MVPGNFLVKSADDGEDLDRFSDTYAEALEASKDAYCSGCGETYYKGCLFPVDLGQSGFMCWEGHCWLMCRRCYHDRISETVWTSDGTKRC